MTLKIGVLLGGVSAEREISLLTGEAIYQALLQKGYNCVKIDPDQQVAAKIAAENLDLAFLALHGKHGEDGNLQGLLEIMGVPYTGSGVLASAISMDKLATKKMLGYDGLPTPKHITVDIGKITEDPQGIAAGIIAELGLPLIVKPPRQGSSIGVSIVRTAEQLPDALDTACRYDPTTVMAEEYIAGQEINAAVLGNKRPLALPLIEILSATEFYDYEAKYSPGMSDHLIPPRLDEKLQETIKDLAVRTFKSLGCRGLARVDFLIDPQGNSYILELNSIPGMTATSLCPEAAKACGIGFADLTELMVKLALDENFEVTL